MSLIHQQFVDHLSCVEAELGEAVSISGLTGPLRIFQRAAGNRHSLDDTTTAWYVLQKCPQAISVLDLGSGVGSVGLIVLWGLSSSAHLTCVEAQDVSFRLLRNNIQCNDLAGRVEALHCDLREIRLAKKFDLITGSPPYFPIHAGTLPADSQKAHARFELRGHVGNYAEIAKRHLTDDGVFVYCFPFRHKERGVKLVEDAGLTIASVRDVVPQEGNTPLFSLYSATLHTQGPLIEEPPFIVQLRSGEYSPEMRAMQLSRGFGPDGTNVIE